MIEPAAPYVIRVSPRSAAWAERFQATGAAMREAIGPAALRIDHIGSTSIAGLAAKPIIDIQISVANLDDFASFGPSLQSLGYVWRDKNPELTKRYFREAPGTERTHVHVRELGSFNQQVALLFRDYLRTSPDDQAAYVAVKQSLAAKFPNDSQAYTDGKDEIIWQILYRADRWAERTGWRPGPSDA